MMTQQGKARFLEMLIGITVMFFPFFLRDAFSIDTSTLTVLKAGTGTGKVIASEINCGDDCTGTYVKGKKITLRANPGSDSKFAGWSGDYTGKSKKIRVSINSDINITATFNVKAKGMKIAEKISVVDTNSTPVLKALKAGSVSAADELLSDSDYDKDKTTVWVNERAAETFKMVNEILCMIGQTRYSEMVNKGDYKVQIDKNLCSSDNDDPSVASQESQNQSSGSTMPKYEMWTVNSSRADNNSPQIVKVWVHESSEDMGDGPGGMAIFAKGVITEGVSETNPYGIFTMTFKMFPEINGTIFPEIMGKGFLKTEIDTATGKVLLKFVSKEDFDIPGKEHIAFIQKATLDRAADGSEGGGTVYNYADEPFMEEPEEETFNFAFDPTNFLRVDKYSNSTCMDRTEFDETTFRYGLYDSNKARVNRNSGFSIKKKQGGKNYYGWIGYYGIWFPKEVTLNNGDQVYKMEPGPDSSQGEPYKVLISGGKLKKYVGKEMTLGDIKNVPLDYWDSTDNKNYRVKWDGTNFMTVEWLDESGDDFLWKKLDTPVPYEISNLNSDMLNFWSQSLGGNVQIKLNCTVQETPSGPPSFTCSADDTLPVVFYAESVIFPSDTVPESLACFSNCPDLDKINSGEQWPYDSTYEQPQDVPPAQAQYISYDFDSQKMLLKYNGTPVLAKGDTYQWGVMSGPLFEPTADNLDLLACDWDSNKTCGWQAWNKLPVYYTWETGPNDWNKFTALVNPLDGTVLKFDPPLQVSYVHTWDDLTTSIFNLEYSGFGNLWGIPGECIDWDTGQEVDCGPDTRWIPQFSISEGSLVTDVVDDVTMYYVKPLEKEQRMKQVDNSYCSGLTTSSYDLPNMTDWEDPDIGPEPVVKSPPAVIGGIVQY